MKKNRKQRPLSFADYGRLSSVITSTLRGTGQEATTSCFFYAFVGAVLLNKRHGLPAKFCAGSAVYRLGAGDGIASQLTYGNSMLSNGEVDFLQFGGDAFHCWIECEGYAIDLMAPLFRDIVARDPQSSRVPRWMFQRQISEAKFNFSEVKAPGDFHLVHDKEFADKLIDLFADNELGLSIGELAASWYRPSPAPLDPEMWIAGSAGKVRRLRLNALELTGAW